MRFVNVFSIFLCFNVSLFNKSYMSRYLRICGTVLDLNVSYAVGSMFNPF